MEVDPELIALLTPLIGAVVALIMQYVKGKDTNKHGDAFIEMLKDLGDSFSKVALVLPQISPYVKEYNDMITEADKIWNSGGLTAEDIQFLYLKAVQYKMQIDAAIAKYRELKSTTTTSPYDPSR